MSLANLWGKGIDVSLLTDQKFYHFQVSDSTCVMNGTKAKGVSSRHVPPARRKSSTLASMLIILPRSTNSYPVTKWLRSALKSLCMQLRLTQLTLLPTCGSASERVKPSHSGPAKIQSKPKNPSFVVVLVDRRRYR